MQVEGEGYAGGGPGLVDILTFYGLIQLRATQPMVELVTRGSGSHDIFLGTKRTTSHNLSYLRHGNPTFSPQPHPFFRVELSENQVTIDNRSL